MAKAALGEPLARRVGVCRGEDGRPVWAAGADGVGKARRRGQPGWLEHHEQEGGPEVWAAAPGCRLGWCDLGDVLSPL